MDNPAHVRHASMADLEGLLPLRVALWPEENGQVHRRELIELFQESGGDTPIFVAADEAGRIVGFLEAALRERAEGCTSAPVGYIEGWYVRPGCRRRGVGRALVAAAEQWARESGCREMASDALLENEASQQAHRHLGYEEVERVVLFRKSL